MGNGTSLVGQRTVEAYKQAWKKLYPNEDVKLTTDGKPVDLSFDSQYLCPKIPWMKDFLEHGQAPYPSSRQPSPNLPQQNPAAPGESSSETNSNPQLEMAGFTDGQISYLRSHGFKPAFSLPFARLEGLFPQLAECAEHPVECLRAFFVLGPEYRLDRGKNSYLCEEEIDESDFYEIESTSPGYIKRLKKTPPSKEGKLLCTYHCWVRLPHYGVLLTDAPIAQPGDRDEGRQEPVEPGIRFMERLSNRCSTG